MLEIKYSEKGRGVFTTSPIKKGDVVEKFPTVILDEQDAKYVWESSKTLLHYVFYMERFKQTVIMLGYASLYNHSTIPNCEIEYDNAAEMRIEALRDIEAGEELMFNYNFDGEEVFVDKSYYELYKHK